jgi:cell wall-associated NlpC family hydrolase
MTRRIFPLIAVAALLAACATPGQRGVGAAGGGYGNYGSGGGGAGAGMGAGAKNNDVVSYAKTLLGTPYHYGGETPRTGFDCSGFVRYVYLHARGVSLPHNTKLQSNQGAQVKYTELRPGDLVFYNTLHRPYSHVVIYIGDRHFIHSPRTGKAVSIENMDTNYWRARYNGARRVNVR